MKYRTLPALALLLFACMGCNAQSSFLWGMTYDGGTDSLGVIFNYNLARNTYAVAHNFNGAEDGGMPQGGLIKANNDLLYGMAQVGGSYGYGTLFSYNIITGAYTKLHDFGNGTDGAYPGGTLMQAHNGIIYGLTQSGGTHENKGTLFSYNIFTNTYTTLYNFGDRFDGISPVGSLIQATDGLLYGCTAYGGTNGLGNLFSYNIGTGVMLRLHNFDEGGSYPTGSVVQANNGLLYGLTWTGGTDSVGTIFSYDIDSNKYTNIHNFGTDSGGINPTGSLIQASNGLLFGTTRYGGILTPQYGTNGIVFSYNIETNSEAVIRDFENIPDGAYASAPLMEGDNGIIYGVTVNGGITGLGFMFGYIVSSNVYVAMHNFALGNDGANPFGGLLEVNNLTAGENQVASNIQLQISPNPSTGQFIVQLPGNQNNYPVEVYNTMGQKVEQLTLSNTQNVLDLTKQSTGIYFVEVQTESGLQTAKVLVIK